MTEHIDRLSLLMYADHFDEIDPEPIAAHVAACAVCRERLEEAKALLRLVLTEDVPHLADDSDDRERLRATVLGDYGRLVADDSAVEYAFDDLRARPLEAWNAFFARHPEHRTGAMAHRILAEAERELDREPDHALKLADAAEEIARLVPDAESRPLLGDVWKQRSNALRHLGRYEEALDAAAIAETLYAALAAGEFDVAQAKYASAGTLFKMTRYDEALAVITAAITSLRMYGASLPLAKSIMLEAAIRAEQGDTTRAQELWRGVLPMLASLNGEIEMARVHANLAECNLRLGWYDAALADARRAVERFRRLGMDAESIRSRWTIGMIDLARGEADAGLDELESTAAAFESRGMTADAGFVKLDICEELLRRQEWTEAEVTARELAHLFGAAHVTLASIRALDYLRRAVENRQATADTVRYIRTYVAADDPAHPFDPPPLIN